MRANLRETAGGGNAARRAEALHARARRKSGERIPRRSSAAGESGGDPARRASRHGRLKPQARTMGSLANCARLRHRRPRCRAHRRAMAACSPRRRTSRSSSRRFQPADVGSLAIGARLRHQAPFSRAHRRAMSACSPRRRTSCCCCREFIRPAPPGAGHSRGMMVPCRSPDLIVVARPLQAGPASCRERSAGGRLGSSGEDSNEEDTWTARRCCSLRPSASGRWS
jgi:hypothetical protein